MSCGDKPMSSSRAYKVAALAATVVETGSRRGVVLTLPWGAACLPFRPVPLGTSGLASITWFARAMAS